jgi:riboflavin synthase
MMGGVFTGIIRHVGQVQDVRATPSGRALCIDLGPLAKGLASGDSMAVCGACLTARDLAPPAAWFDVIAETLHRTSLGALRPGSRVNLEPALTLADGLDGHIVQGHVDGLARVEGIDRTGGQWTLRCRCEPSLTDGMVPKGSLALDGVSLTLIDVASGAFSVGLIPTTLDETTLADRTPGDAINVEIDVLGKYVRAYLQGQARPSSGGVSLDTLRKAGFA